MPWPARMTLILAAASLLFHFYVALRAAGALAQISGLPIKRMRAIAIAAICALMIYPIALAFGYLFNLRGALAALQLNSALVYPFWVGLVLSVQLALLLLAVEAGFFLIRLFSRAPMDRLVGARAWLIVGLMLACAAYVPARIYNDTFRVRAREAALEVAGLPAELNGLRIAHIADLQVDDRTNGRKLDNYIEAVNRLSPDLVIFCGDLVTSGTDHIEAAARALGRIKSRFGIYACLGDHDYFSNRRLVAESLRRNGIAVLENESLPVRAGGHQIALTGITNVYRDQATAGEVESVELRRPPAALKIFFTHQPSRWLVRFASERGYDLFLAGHTHGGQIAFPLPGFLLTGSRLETPYVTGFHRSGKMLISVNNGLGLTLAPIRYHAPAEVTLIVVKSG